MNKFELIAEKQIEELQNSHIPVEIKKINKDEYYVEISIEGGKIYELLETDINFLLTVGPSYPFKPPRLYCLTQFCVPCFADGRDLLDDVINTGWTPEISLVQVIEKIPFFLAEFIDRLREGTIIFYGNYFLGEKYDTNILQNLPVYFKTVKQKVIVENKEKIIERFMLVSDLNICLFEDDKWTLKNSATLIFWASVRSVLQIKRSIDENTVKFVFKEKYRKVRFSFKKENCTLTFQIDQDTDEIITNILNVLKILGIGFNKVNKGGPKTGEIPKIDIEMVEFNIKQLEMMIGGENESSAGLDELQILMDFYQKAIEYYSATNDARYEAYLARLTSLMKLSANHKKAKEVNKAEIKVQPVVKTSNEKNVNAKISESKVVEKPQTPKEEIMKSEESKQDIVETKKESAKPVLKKPEPTKDLHFTNQEGIVIEQSDLPNFDDGNESPDSG